MRATGHVWSDDDARAAAAIIPHDALTAAVSTLTRALTAQRPQSSLVIGERGTGKTTVLNALAKQLHEAGWIIFVCGHSELVAGQIYIGQFEERLRNVVAQLRGNRRILWIIPNFHSLAMSGRHQYSPVSALDVILPLAESGDLKIVGECAPPHLERRLRDKPTLASSFAALRLEPLPSDAMLTLAGDWATKHCAPANAAVIPLAWDLARQYLTDQAAPGNLMSLLDATVTHLKAAGATGKVPLAINDIVATLSQQTGLPLDLLDERRSLDLDALRARLAQRVIGQSEAVDCLVERVALMKAGLNDPTRPIGVFLFAGPTGTGKTEIAKTLAEWLFGSADRLIRIDMSQLQSMEGLDRLLGTLHDDAGDSLVERIRKQPYALLLLDEFEKAHQRVWDIFLQVFDDARITGRRGQTASFRHAIIILTSNLGATIPTGVSLGFGNKPRSLDELDVHRVIDQTFRKEFINRLDRVIVFAPLTRETMRQILHKELTEAFQRRGLKDRAWAVEWDESAIDFLLDKGFTPDLGARPLKRAVEKYLLSPLAVTIVGHQVPAGDQFLFVSARDDRLDVTFVDPDAVDAEPQLAPRPAQAGRSLKDIVRQTFGSPDEQATLRGEHDALLAEVSDSAWHARKDAAMAAMQHPEFWSLPDRFATLGLVEYIDRIDAGVTRAGSLLARLQRQGGRHGALPAKLVRVLAQNLYLLRTASRDVSEGRDRDAFLSIEAMRDGLQDWLEAADFANRLADMYRAWAKSRGMTLQLLSSDAAKGQHLFAVSGYGAHTLLAQEAGMHVLEAAGDKPRQIRRSSARVRVAAQDAAPHGDGVAALLRRAVQATSG